MFIDARMPQSWAIIKDYLQNFSMIFVLVRSANNLLNFGFHNAGMSKVLVNKIMKSRKKQLSSPYWQML